MTFFDVVKVVELHDPADVNAYLATGRWKLLGQACGTRYDRDDHVPVSLYSLGWLGPADPAHPELDASEFPELPAEEPEIWI